MIALEVDGIFTDGIEDTVTYHDGVSSSDINAVVNLSGDGNGGQADHATITVKKSEVPDPQYRHTFTIDGVVWYISSDKDKGLALEGDEYCWVIRISKNERFSQWRT
jgi:hypothetical protein